MPYTLHRYILRELMRIFILAVVALTLILSLGSILQPVQEYGAGPRQVIYLMVYFLPITLTFVLPIAALFAGALVYGRFAGDNELDACRASGISILTLIRPGLHLAIAVAIANLLLSFLVMPKFVHLAEQSLKADAKQMLFRNIQKKGFYEMPSDNRYQYLIYADIADSRSDTLWGIIVTKVENGRIEQVITAESASITFATNQGTSQVQIIARNAYQMDAEGVVTLDSAPVTQDFSSLLGDDIAFKRIDEMRKIQEDLTYFEPIAQKAKETFAQLAIELLAEQIQAKISEKAATGTESLTTAEQEKFYFDLPGEPNCVRFTATQCSVKEKKINLTGEITAVEYAPGSRRPIHTLKSSQAYVTLEVEGSKAIIEMDIRNAQIDGSNQLKMRHIIQGLRLPEIVETITSRFITESGTLSTQRLTGDLTVLARFKPTSRLSEMQSGLRRLIQKTSLEIKAEIHSRIVFAAGCIAMILIGIGLGIIRRDGHLLSAFGASCIPAAVLIVCIMSGKQLTKNLGAQAFSGVMVMWAGLGFLCLVALLIYYKLMKN
jgi:lipopolysaccharide export LptBFGC system permease protein LptF